MKFVVALLVLSCATYSSANYGGMLGQLVDARTDQAKEMFAEIKKFGEALQTFVDNIVELKTRTRSLLNMSIETLDESEARSKEIHAEFITASNSALEAINKGIEDAAAAFQSSLNGI
ncbi:uncharacterized protein LOC141857305 [Brevipalpus obovatus]|uniref:uncharacterized protein LOC141857305 n=1 Tax=Brevipalpus obovatus TaxID=246614 RepID=UPI003D9F1873